MDTRKKKLILMTQKRRRIPFEGNPYEISFSGRRLEVLVPP
jgi:hypothetical protein